MLLDYSVVVPGIAAAVMGAVSIFAADTWRWKKRLVAALTVIAIAGMVGSQWWTNYKQDQEIQKRTETREQLGHLLANGEELRRELLAHLKDPIPTTDLTAWEQKTGTFLNSLGPSYRTRFDSSDEVSAFSLNGTDQAHTIWYNWLSVRLKKLDQFVGEFSVPRQPR